MKLLKMASPKRCRFLIVDGTSFRSTIQFSRSEALSGPPQGDANILLPGVVVKSFFLLNNRFFNAHSRNKSGNGRRILLQALQPVKLIFLQAVKYRISHIYSAVSAQRFRTTEMSAAWARLPILNLLS